MCKDTQNEELLFNSLTVNVYFYIIILNNLFVYLVTTSRPPTCYAGGVCGVNQKQGPSEEDKSTLIWLQNMKLSEAETRALVTAMRDRVQTVALVNVTLDIEELTQYDGQGHCSELEVWGWGDMR